MRARDWKTLQPAFRRYCFRRTVAEVARQVPASRVSVYRWLKGETQPTGAARVRIQQILKEQT